MQLFPFTHITRCSPRQAMQHEMSMYGLTGFHQEELFVHAAVSRKGMAVT
jgi:hypothetical protein